MIRPSQSSATLRRWKPGRGIIPTLGAGFSWRLPPCGNPVFWSVKDGAIHGATNETRGELLLTDGNYGDFRLVLKSRLVNESNHLGVCFWGQRLADFRYGDCVLVIPPHGGMWDYRPGKGRWPAE
jgi:hypothetical protein